MKAFKFALAAGVAATVMAAAPAYAQFTERNIRLSNGVNEDHPNGKGVEKFRACLADKSGGKLKVQGFWGNALGGDLQATQALRSGTQEMAIVSPGLMRCVTTNGRASPRYVRSARQSPALSRWK